MSFGIKNINGQGKKGRPQNPRTYEALTAQVLDSKGTVVGTIEFTSDKAGVHLTARTHGGKRTLDFVPTPTATEKAAPKAKAVKPAPEVPAEPVAA